MSSSSEHTRAQNEGGKEIGRMREESPKRVLIVSGESPHRKALAAAVRQGGFEATPSTTAEEASRLLMRGRFLAILCEDKLPDGDFRTVIAQAEPGTGCTPVIVVSRRDEWESYMLALAAGASDYLAFPPYPGEVERSLARAREVSKSSADAA
jgi:two-component system, OmpR family, response regulator VicR